MYSLRSLICHMVLYANPLYREDLDDMTTLNDKMIKIWKTRQVKGWDLIGHHLEGIWRKRSLMVSKYLKRNPESEFYDIFEPLILSDNVTTMGLDEVRDDNAVQMIETLLRVKKSMKREIRCCLCVIVFVALFAQVLIAV